MASRQLHCPLVPVPAGGCTVNVTARGDAGRILTAAAQPACVSASGRREAIKNGHPAGRMVPAALSLQTSLPKGASLSLGRVVTSGPSGLCHRGLPVPPKPGGPGTMGVARGGLGSPGTGKPQAPRGFVEGPCCLAFLG